MADGALHYYTTAYCSLLFSTALSDIGKLSWPSRLPLPLSLCYTPSPSTPSPFTPSAPPHPHPPPHPRHTRRLLPLPTCPVCLPPLPTRTPSSGQCLHLSLHPPRHALPTPSPHPRHTLRSFSLPTWRACSPPPCRPHGATRRAGSTPCSTRSGWRRYARNEMDQNTYQNRPE